MDHMLVTYLEGLSKQIAELKELIERRCPVENEDLKRKQFQACLDAASQQLEYVKCAKVGHVIKGESCVRCGMPA